MDHHTHMNRRSFLRFLPAAVGGLALAEAIPFNRVWSFPSKIVLSKPKYEVGVDYAFDQDIAAIIVREIRTGRLEVFHMVSGEELAVLRRDPTPLAGLHLPDGTNISPAELLSRFPSHVHALDGTIGKALGFQAVNA